MARAGKPPPRNDQVLPTAGRENNCASPEFKARNCRTLKAPSKYTLVARASCGDVILVAAWKYGQGSKVKLAEDDLVVPRANDQLLVDFAKSSIGCAQGRHASVD